jgi:L-alanine-DL-glutamate epimerase-like enolase superfamily enzyme
VRLEWTPIELDLLHPWTIARGTSLTKTNVLTRLACAGFEGLGEAAPSARYGESAASVLTALGNIAQRLGDDLTDLDAILDRLDASLPGQGAARASIDIALHDWSGRRDGTPLWRRFGADPRRTPLTSMSIGLDRTEVMQEKVREAAGFRVLKIKVGDARDLENLAAIRALTDVPLYVDANEGWRDPDRAVEMIHRLQGMGVVLIEQPLPAADLDGAMRVRDRVDLPIVADEAVQTVEDIPPLARAYDGINVKVQKAGGLRMARRMIDTARSLGMKVMLGCMIETSVGITAAAHLSPLADYADLDGNLLLARDPYRGACLQDGRLIPPDRPGLGVEGGAGVFDENTAGR